MSTSTDGHNIPALSTLDFHRTLSTSHMNTVYIIARAIYCENSNRDRSNLCKSRFHCNNANSGSIAREWPECSLGGLREGALNAFSWQFARWC